MSLAGNLKDLSLGEILQIIGLSRKTGILSLSSNRHEGGILFRHGAVISATSSELPQELGELLIHNGLTDSDTLLTAFSRQQVQGFRERLDVILTTQCGLPRDAVEEIIRERIIATVYSLFAWTEGTFTFKACEADEFADPARIISQQFMLYQGLNTRFLAMEGTRLAALKISGNDGAIARSRISDEESGNFQPDEKVLVPSSDGTSVAPLLIIDDDAPTLRFLSEGLREQGYTVHSLGGGHDTLDVIKRMVCSGGRPKLLVDLIMPRMDGSGVLGGLELLELVRRDFDELLIMIMSDYHHDESENRIRALNCPFLLKPRRSQISDSKTVQDFIAAVHQQLTILLVENSRLMRL